MTPKRRNGDDGERDKNFPIISHNFDNSSIDTSMIKNSKKGKHRKIKIPRISAKHTANISMAPEPEKLPEITVKTPHQDNPDPNARYPNHNINVKANLTTPKLSLDMMSLFKSTSKAIKDVKLMSSNSKEPLKSKDNSSERSENVSRKNLTRDIPMPKATYNLKTINIKKTGVKLFSLDDDYLCT
jgi:hypothetical protein